jgi:uncharacterized protein
MRAVSNAGPLIHLSWLGLIDVLPNLFEYVSVPVAVRDEVLNVRSDVPGRNNLLAAFSASWLNVLEVTALHEVNKHMLKLHRGEAEAIVLMREVEGDILLLDDGRARRIARDADVPILGTVGVLRAARDEGRITRILPLLDALRAQGFRISDEVIEQIRQEEN